MPWSCKIASVLELNKIQECFMPNLKPLVQKSVIYQIQRKTPSDRAKCPTIHYISKGY